MGDPPNFNTLEICIELFEGLRRLGREFAVSPIQEFETVLTLVQQLCCLFICSTWWKLSKQYKVDTIHSMGRTIRLMLRVDGILAGQETVQNADVLSLSQSDLILNRPHITGNWTTTDTSADKLYGVRLELRMVIDLMELMQHVNDTHKYESDAIDDMLLLTGLRNWHTRSIFILKALASQTQLRHITSQHQDLQHKMTGYEGFLFDPQDEGDDMMLLDRWPCKVDVQDISVALGKLTPRSRECILEFVENRGDYMTFKHDLFFITENTDGACFFVIKYYPDPGLSLPQLKQLYSDEVSASNGHRPSEPEAQGTLVHLSEPWDSSAIQRWQAIAETSISFPAYLGLLSSPSTRVPVHSHAGRKEACYTHSLDTQFPYVS